MHLAILGLVVELGEGFGGAFGHDLLAPISTPCDPDIDLYETSSCQYIENLPYHCVVDELTNIVRLAEEVEDPHKLEIVVGDPLGGFVLNRDWLVLLPLLIIVLGFGILLLGDILFLLLRQREVDFPAGPRLLQFDLEV